MALKIFQPAFHLFCKTFGHRWRYMDYSNYMKADGDSYDFKASRHCTHCQQREYFYHTWVAAAKSPLDYEKAYYASRKIIINDVIYR